MKSQQASSQLQGQGKSRRASFGPARDPARARGGDIILETMRRDVLDALADDDAVWNSDETGFPKMGTKSVGVKRQ